MLKRCGPCVELMCGTEGYSIETIFSVRGSYSAEKLTDCSPQLCRDLSFPCTRWSFSTPRLVTGQNSLAFT